MSDFDNLSDRDKFLLKVKLDGHIEAAVQAARMKNMGVREALSLTVAAVVREFAAYSTKPDKANEIWAMAVHEVYGSTERRVARMIN